MNTYQQENYFSDIIKKDNPILSVDPGIAKRLEYLLLLKAKNKKSVPDSIHSIFSSFFSLQYLGMKVGIITAFILFLVFFNKIPTGNIIPGKNNFLIADSSYCDTVNKSTFDSNSILK